MNKSHLTIASVAVAVPVIALQFFQNSKLKSQVTRLEKTIIEYAPSSKGSIAYRELAREFLKKNGITP